MRTAPLPRDASQAPDTLSKSQQAYGWIKERIASLNDGKRPLGNPSRATLVDALKELEGAAA